MTTCLRTICTDETDGEAYCSERCEKLSSPKPKKGEKLDHKEQYSRARVIHNDR